MSKILSDITVAHYANHAAQKYPEMSAEREIIETLIQSHQAQALFISSLEEECRERFEAVESLGFALAETNPQLFEEVCKRNPYLSMLKARGVF